MDELQFSKLQAGDVLVCPVTSPVRSVLFPSVLATNAGGLSHPAIITRCQHRWPPGNATSILHDGQIVAVDGTAGIAEAQQLHRHSPRPANVVSSWYQNDDGRGQGWRT